MARINGGSAVVSLFDRAWRVRILFADVLRANAADLNRYMWDKVDIVSLAGPGRFTYSYSKAKNSQPADDRIYLAIHEMDYNNLSSSSYYIYYMISYSHRGISGLDVILYGSTSQTKSTKVSLLVIDNSFHLFN